MDVRPATRDRLGAIIVGNGFNITEEGVLSIDESAIEPEEYVEFTRERLLQLFEERKAWRR